MDKEFGWILLFLLLIFVMWYSQGGVFDSGIKLEPPRQSSDGERYGFFQSNETIKESKESEKIIPEGQSPYKDMISIKTTSVKTENAQDEHISIQAHYNNKEGVNISGWILKNNKNETAVIGRGAYLPYSARVNPQEDIVLQPRENAIILTGKSPIGTNFKVNICTGYFNQFQSFTPPLPNKCPYQRSAPGLYDLDDSCIDYVESLSRCTMPISSGRYSDACGNFISLHANYNGCVNDYKDSDNFYSRDWRVYLGRESELWKGARGTIKVIDEFGRLIKEVSY